MPTSRTPARPPPLRVNTPLSGLERDTVAVLRNDARMPFSTLARTAAASLLTYAGVFRDEEHLADFLTGGFEGSEEVTSLECSFQVEVFKRYWTARP